MVWNKTLRLFHRKVLCLRRLPIEPLRCRNYGFQWYWDLLRSIGFDGYNGLQKSLWHVIFSITVLPRRFTDVGELLDGGVIKQKRSDLKDADQYTTPGTYFVNLWGGVWQNMPTNDCFGLFEVRSYDGYITQRLSAGNGKVFVRIKESEKPFKPWPTAAQ